MTTSARKQTKQRAQARQNFPKILAEPPAQRRATLGCEIVQLSTMAPDFQQTAQRTQRTVTAKSGKSRQAPSAPHSPLKASSSTRRAAPTKHTIRRATPIDKLAPRRIRSETYRRRFQKFKQMASTKSSSRSLASVKTDLALAKLAQEKQAAVIRQMQEKLDKAKSRVASANTELECPICKEILARPLALYPCGHIFCEDCLLRTFCTALLGEEPETTHATRTKQCPDCRSSVHVPPIPVYLVKNLISTINPDLDEDGSRTNGFGLDLGPDIPEGSDPWSVIFPDDLADVMTLTSESEGEGRSVGSRATGGSYAALDPWETAVGHLSQSVRNSWVLEVDGTPAASEASGDEDEMEEDDGVASSTSTENTARLYNIAPLFMSPSANDIPHHTSDATFDDEAFSLSEESGEEDDLGDRLEPMNVDLDDDFELHHPNQLHILEAYRQRHRVPTPIRNNAWISRSWEAPAFISEDADEYMNAQERTLHQRGIPLDMQDKFQIAYTNRLGLSVQLGLGNVIFLGWNVTILWTNGDRDGSVFMAYIRWEMMHHPERWNVHLHQDGSWDAHRLRCVNTETGINAYASLDEEDIEGSDTE